jgi:diphthine synthase
MLFFVGLGVDQTLGMEALAVLERCDAVFYESYTSPKLGTAQIFLQNSQRKIESVSREFVEDGRRILELAMRGNVALLSSGDPMIATTHEELRIRAIEKGIETRIIHGSSILSCLPGELGLHAYSFGKCVTVTREPMQYTAYETIFQNLLLGLHTAILLEWDEKSGFFLSPKEAIASLQSSEKDLKYDIILENTLVLGASAIGSGRTKITSCHLGDVPSTDFGDPPNSLVIPGKLHFTEVEALAALFHKPVEFFSDNASNVKSISRSMISRYSARTFAALERARAALKGKQSQNLSQIESVFENVEAYTQDAVRFMNQGKQELAVLSMGYAEGLLDSMRFLGILNFEW